MNKKLLSIAITLIIVAIALAWVFLSKIKGTTIPPYIDMSIEAIDLDGENVRITVTHNGGDSIPSAEKSIILVAETENENMIEVSMGWPQTFSQDDVGSGIYTYGQNPAGKTIEVIVYYGVGIFETEVQIEQ